MTPGGPAADGSLTDERKALLGAAIALDFTFDCKYLLDLESVVHKQIPVYMLFCHLVNSPVIQV